MEKSLVAVKLDFSGYRYESTAEREGELKLQNLLNKALGVGLWVGANRCIDKFFVFCLAKGPNGTENKSVTADCLMLKDYGSIAQSRQIPFIFSQNWQRFLLPIHF